MCRLSIITINLNNDEGLKKTIESVINQTFSGFELIIIDGNSTDRSVDIIKAFSKNITYWISEPDLGIYNAMNKGIRHAKGDYCLFLNSGDWLTSPTILEDVFKINPKADIVAGDVYFFDTLQNKIHWHIKSPDVFTAKTLFNGTLPHQSTFIKRQLFSSIGLYNENLKIASDWLFWIEALLEKGCSYSHFNKVVSYFNMDGISCNPSTNSLPRKEQLLILQKKYPFFIEDYEQFAALEKDATIWKASKEFKAFEILTKTGLIKLTIFFIRVQHVIQKKLRFKYQS